MIIIRNTRPFPPSTHPTPPEWHQDIENASVYQRRDHLPPSPGSQSEKDKLVCDNFLSAQLVRFSFQILTLDFLLPISRAVLTIHQQQIPWQTAIKKYPSYAASPSSPSPVDNRIERDTIISENVIVGWGASSFVVVKHSCVVDVHEKYYNKWFMSKVPSKK